MTGLSLQNCLVLAGGCLLVAALALQSLISWFIAPKTPAGFSATRGATSREPGKTREWLTIVGPVGAGKTSLFYKLLTKDRRDTVSSTDCNMTNGIMEVKLPKSVTGSSHDQDGTSKALQIIDIPGHYNFREKITQTIEQSKALILMIDSKNKETFTEAAEIMYEIIGNVGVVSDRVPLLVACNKQDLPFAKRSIQIERELTTEIEQIRKVRQATREQDAEHAQAAGQVVEGDYLESLKGKFSFAQLSNPVQFCDCSLVQDNIDEIYRFLLKNC